MCDRIDGRREDGGRSPEGIAPGASLAIGPLAGSELDRASHVLARAFRDNPLNLAVMPGRSPAGRVRTNQAGLSCQLASAHAGGLVLGAREGARLHGALVAALPGRHPLPLPPLSLRVWAFLVQGPRVSERWSRVFDALHAVHPLAPHWYLSVLGVAPERAGRGVGSALLRALLERVDADPFPVYLETDAVGNLRFYERAGFRVTRELRVLDVPVWCLERPAGGPPLRVV